MLDYFVVLLFVSLVIKSTTVYGNEADSITQPSKVRHWVNHPWTPHQVRCCSYIASSGGSDLGVKLLIEEGADVNACPGVRAQCPCHNLSPGENDGTGW